MNNLGYAPDNGLGGLPLDPVTGAKWLRQAADRSGAKAQASLGEMRTGRGFPGMPWRRPASGCAWPQARGSVDGKHSAPEVALLLTPAELQKGQRPDRFFPEAPPGRAGSSEPR